MAEPSRFAYDTKLARYRDLRTGRFLAHSTIRQAVDQVAKVGGDRMAAITGRLRSGVIDLPTWQVQMAGEIKTLHVTQATAAKGGKAQMSPADYGRVGAEVKKQYQYLARFAEDVASGKQTLDGRAENRARLYGEAGRGTFEDQRRHLWADKGAIEERRVLHAAEHCADCVAAAGRGWSPEGALPRIGASACRTRCKCTFTFRMAPLAVAA